MFATEVAKTETFVLFDVNIGKNRVQSPSGQTTRDP